jgi:hypothetical protein
MGNKPFNIVRDARGKIDKTIDKEFDNVTKQVEDKFNGMLNKLNAYDVRNVSELRKIDLDTATLGECMNFIGTWLKDMKDILST